MQAFYSTVHGGHRKMITNGIQKEDGAGGWGCMSPERNEVE